MLASLCGQITLHIYSLNNYIAETCGIHHIVLQLFAKEQNTMATPFLWVATPFRRVTHPFLWVMIEISGRCHKSCHNHAECWDVPFAHLRDVTTIQQDNTQPYVANVSIIRQCPWTPHCPSRVGQYSTLRLAIIDNLVWSMRRRCTARRDATGQGTYQIPSCEFRHITPYVLMALFVIVHWISVCKMFELCYIMIHKCILKINYFITCTIMRN